MPFHSSSVTVEVAPSGAVSVVGIGVSLSARPDAILELLTIPLGLFDSNAPLMLLCATAWRVANVWFVRLRRRTDARSWLARDLTETVDRCRVVACDVPARLWSVFECRFRRFTESVNLCNGLIVKQLLYIQSIERETYVIVF